MFIPSMLRVLFLVVELRITNVARVVLDVDIFHVPDDDCHSSKLFPAQIADDLWLQPVGRILVWDY